MIFKNYKLNHWFSQVMPEPSIRWRDEVNSSCSVIFINQTLHLYLRRIRQTLRWLVVYFLVSLTELFKASLSCIDDLLMLNCHTTKYWDFKNHSPLIKRSTRWIITLFDMWHWRINSSFIVAAQLFFPVTIVCVILSKIILCFFSCNCVERWRIRCK